MREGKGPIYRARGGLYETACSKKSKEL